MKHDVMKRVLLLICMVVVARAGWALGRPGREPEPDGAEIDAAVLPGADAGAQINAADARLGTAAGTIVYRSKVSATASTPVVLNSRHALVLASPVTWQSTIKLPAGSSEQAISCPALQTLAYAKGTTWIDASRTSLVSLHDCMVMSTLTTGENVAIGGGALTRLSAVKNSMRDTQLLAAGSTAATYEAVTAANSSSDLTVTDNQGRGTTGKGVFMVLMYTNRALIARNTVSNYFFGVQWWGGDSCLAGCSAGGNGAAANLRKVSDVMIRDNRIMATQACIWGSMGQRLTISGNTCAAAGPRSGDVGIDLEGTQDSTVTGNSVHGYANGSLATFFLATRNVWSGNDVRDEGGEAPIGIHNSSQNPAGLSETFTNNTFTCTKTCATLVEATGQLTINQNHFSNVYLITGFNVSHVSIVGNWLTDTVAMPGGINVTTLVGADGRMGSAEVRGNTLTSSAAAGVDSSAIAVSGNDFNNPQQTLIDSNVMGGAGAFPTDITCAAVSGNSAGQGNHCTISDNTLASDRIVTKSTPNTAVVVVKRNNHCRAGGTC